MIGMAVVGDMVTPKVPTLKDVAQLAGVHVATASRALNDSQTHLISDATRARVLAASSSLGYRANAVAQSLRMGSTKTVGVIVASLSNPFIGTLLRGIEDGLRATNILPLVVSSHDDPDQFRQAVSRLLSNRVDGMIICAAHLDDAEFIVDLQSKVPLVLAVRNVGSDAGRSSDPGGNHGSRSNERVPILHQVMNDDTLGARTAVNHLISQGHRCLAQIPGDKSISSFIERGNGFRQAVADHADVTDVSTGAHAFETTVSEGRRLATELLRSPAETRPTAIFAHNDLMAVGAIDALRDLGLDCPSDVSVVGYNDAPLSDHIAPPMTTVRLPSYEVGQHSARLILDQLAGSARDAGQAQVLLPPEFIERKSTTLRQ